MDAYPRYETKIVSLALVGISKKPLSFVMVPLTVFKFKI